MRTSIRNLSFLLISALVLATTSPALGRKLARNLLKADGDVVMISGSGSGFSYALSLTVSNGIYVGVDSAKSTVTTPPAMNGGSPTTYIISGIGMAESLLGNTNAATKDAPYFDQDGLMVTCSAKGVSFLLKTVKFNNVAQVEIGVAESMNPTYADRTTIMGLVADVAADAAHVDPTYTSKSLGCYPDYVVDAKDAGTNSNDVAWTGGSYSYRDLPHAKVDLMNTKENCLKTAIANQSPYFGLAMGTECWYGDVTTNLSTLLSKNKIDGKCAAVCPGDNTQMCGGGSGAISIFSVINEALMQEEALGDASDKDAIDRFTQMQSDVTMQSVLQQDDANEVAQQLDTVASE